MSDTGRPGQRWWKIDFVILLLFFLWLLFSIRTLCLLWMFCCIWNWYCILGVMFYIGYGTLLIARLFDVFCFVYLTVLLLYFVSHVCTHHREDSLYPDRCPCSSPPCDYYSSRWDNLMHGIRFGVRGLWTVISPQLETECHTWGLLVAHGPPVALPTCLCACISARLFGFPRVLGTEGLCNPRKACVVSVRRRRPGCSERENWDSIVTSRREQTLLHPARARLPTARVLFIVTVLL